MHRRPARFVLRLRPVVLLAMCLAAALWLPSALAQQPRRPNVLFIAVDDLRPDIGCYGHPEAKTPHIDALASRGMVFRRACCQQAVCSPSRTSLLTGLRPDSTKVYDLETHFRNTIPDVVTLPQHFKAHGYHTVGMGKIYHGGLDDRESWSEPHMPAGGVAWALPENQQIRAASVAKAKAAGKKGKAAQRAGRGPAWESADVPDETYADGSLAEKAIAKLQEIKDQPFFLAVGFVKPHLPFNAPKKYFDLYDPATLKLASNPSPPKDAPPYAVTNFGELRNYHGVPKQGPIPESMARELVHAYRAATSFTDANVGKLLAELDRLGLADNTIVVLWGDHGWKLGEHGSWCKHSNMENDTNAPLIISAPGLKARGKATEALVEFVDIYPTLCELAGLPLPAHLEGTSARPLLDDPQRAWKSAAFSQYPRMHEGVRLMGYAMKTDRYRYVEWQNRQTGEIVAQELYDHQTDPAENRNIAADATNKDLLGKLSAQLKAGWQAARPE